MGKIVIEVIINKPIHVVWDCWIRPEHITNWNFASDDWECPIAENNVVVGGKFSWKMSAKDGSMSFAFEGTYTYIKDNEVIKYKLDDDRQVKIEFKEMGIGVKIIETFDAETENSEENQKNGWQSILNNFKKYAESLD